MSADVRQVPLAVSLTKAGTVSAPGAGASVISLSAPPPGDYRIELRYCLTGTAETALQNCRLKTNGVTYFDNMPSLSGAGWVGIVIDRVNLDGTNAVQFVAIAAATAGAVYSAILVVSRVV